MNGIDAMAALHALDWRETHPFLGNTSEPGGGLRAHLDQLTEWYGWAARGRPYPITDTALAYLQAGIGQLQDTREVFLWGDARPGNILFADDQSVAAVLDWEGALVGPRALDVAYWLMSDLFHADAIGIARAPGWPAQHEVLARYREASGCDVTDIDYFIVMGAFFMGTTLIRATDNGIAAGRLPPGSTMGHANTLTQILADRLGMAIPPLSPDFIAHRGLPAGTMGLANQTAP
jgi:aminoglycoside phosphotransferase (APT) family kinase protein